jgi:ubiquinone/menaquinone biosynthesis C-methylase UbiE
MELQLDWDIDKLKPGWAAGPDTVHVIGRVSELSPQVTADGAPRRVLEVAAAEAVHACKLSLQGMETFVVEPSPSMIKRARERMTEYGAQVVLIRGVAETLPFRDHTFDRVLLDSAIDHLGEPELGIREMTRVLRPDGRLVITFVNYESLSVRLSRCLYGVARRLGVTPRETNLFWDTPVPLEHTFECTYPLLSKMCDPYLELDNAFGVSIGWMVPGWAALLKRLPEARAEALMRGLDRVAHRAPRMADFVMTVWRPRPDGAAPSPAAPHVAGPDERAVSARDLLYPSRSRAEAEFWARTDFRGGFFGLARPGSGDALERRTNEAYTGDPMRSWIDDLIARGPFNEAATLGCDHGSFERYWLTHGGSSRLDVYELSAGVIGKVRAGLGLGWAAAHGPGRRVRFIRTDLNFVHLPENRYDVIWSSGCLHHIVEIEHLLAEVERALCPGGLFAIRDYVGEPRMQFAPERLARINAVLHEIPARYRRVEALVPAPLSSLSPFCGVRSDAILALAEARFDVVHKALAGALFPLTFAVDLAAIEREAPDVLARLLTAEEEALHDPSVRACGVYAVFRKRGARTFEGAEHDR